MDEEEDRYGEAAAPIKMKDMGNRMHGGHGEKNRCGMFLGMKHYIFRVKPHSTPDQAYLELLPFLFDLYETDDAQTGAVNIGGYAEGEIPPEFTHVTLESSTDAINWQEQWASFAPDFHHNLAHIDLSEFGSSTLVLKPGAGFGDFSHPTTRLALSLVAPLVKNATVFDMGCGSGILSIAAALLGAKQVFGIDIDDAALTHARENAHLNKVSQIHFAKHIEPINSKPPYLIVMNMIETEQQAAWQAATALHSLPAHIVTSGILSSEKQHYLKLTEKWHWKLKEERTEGEWSGFLFKNRRKTWVFDLFTEQSLILYRTLF